jgi:DHA1 family tetracycline resistance protein-like MFS transporter
VPTQNRSEPDSSTPDHPAPGAGSLFANHSIVVLAVSVFLNFTGFTLILPVIPFLVGQYVAPELVGFYVGLIVSAFAFCAFCAAPVLGALSDRQGRRPIFIISLLGSAAGYVVFGIGGALWVLFLGRIVDGLTAGSISTIYAYVADTSAPQDRGRIYGLLGAIGGFGFMLGPVAGGVLGTLSPTAPLFAAAGLTLVNAAWVYFALPESVRLEKERPAWRWRQMNPLSQLVNVARTPVLRIPFLAAFSFFFAGAMLQSNLSVYLKDVFQFGPTGIGWTLFGVGVMDIISQGFLTRALMPRLGAEALTRLGLAINAVGFGIIACLVFVPRVELLAGSVFVFTLGDGLFQPAMSAIIANAAPANAQGAVQGANQAQQSMARMSGPLLAAFLSPIALSAPYIAGGLVVLLGLVSLSIRARTAA